MIEVNLIEKKRGSKPVVVLGVDVRTINIKLFVLAIVIYYVPKSFLSGIWTEELQKLDQEISVLETQSKALQVELEGFDNVKTELEAYRKQIDKLRERSAQVDSILKEKTSPKRLLELMARSAPEDLWFDELTIGDDKSFRLVGGADNYKAIGDLILALNQTPYFKGGLNLAKSETKEEVEGSRKIRVENYEIEGRVDSFEIVGR